MTHQRLIDLMKGAVLPETVEESVFLYTYTAAETGASLFDIVIELSGQYDESDADQVHAIIMAYALSTKDGHNDPLNNDDLQ